jgi:hypothetical protein
MMALDLLVGSGGVLSHAPRRIQAALMLVDSFQPMGITTLAVDSIFMMPQLGVLSTEHPEAATQVFERDCLVILGVCIAPVGTTRGGKPLAQVSLDLPDGKQELSIAAGDLLRIPLGPGQTARCVVTPAKKVDVGAGPGQPIEKTVEGGEVGVLLDGRGRPMLLPDSAGERVAAIEQWIENLDLYPRNA